MRAVAASCTANRCSRAGLGVGFTGPTRSHVNACRVKSRDSWELPVSWAAHRGCCGSAPLLGVAGVDSADTGGLQAGDVPTCYT